jgi:hypothetical protein
VFWHVFYTFGFWEGLEGSSENGRTVRILHLMNYPNSSVKKWCSGTFFAFLDFWAYYCKIAEINNMLVN